MSEATLTTCGKAQEMLSDGRAVQVLFRPEGMTLDNVKPYVSLWGILRSSAWFPSARKFVMRKVRAIYGAPGTYNAAQPDREVIENSEHITPDTSAKTKDGEAENILSSNDPAYVWLKETQ